MVLYPLDVHQEEVPKVLHSMHEPIEHETPVFHLVVSMGTPKYTPLGGIYTISPRIQACMVLVPLRMVLG
jgi:hypothetical protein